MKVVKLSETMKAVAEYANRTFNFATIVERTNGDASDLWREYEMLDRIHVKMFGYAANDEDIMEVTDEQYELIMRAVKETCAA